MSEEFHALDPRRLLASAAVYRLAQAAIRGDRPYRIISDRYLRPRPGDRILDVGCGPAEFLSYLPDIEYVGLDMSAQYIEAAERKFGDRGRFLCKPLDAARIDELGAESFDLVFAFGLVHHLDDDESKHLFELARSALKPDGRLVTIDGCFVPGQSRVVRALLENDRGRFVRDEAGYVGLARSVFGSVEAELRRDLLRIPYALLVLECAR